MLGGDITGKAIVPLVARPAPRCARRSSAPSSVLSGRGGDRGAREADRGHRLLRSHRCTPEEARGAARGRRRPARALRAQIVERVEQWMELAEERLAHDPVLRERGQRRPAGDRRGDRRRRAGASSSRAGWCGCPTRSSWRAAATRTGRHGTVRATSRSRSSPSGSRRSPGRSRTRRGRCSTSTARPMTPSSTRAVAGGGHAPAPDRRRDRDAAGREHGLPGRDRALPAAARACTATCTSRAGPSSSAGRCA